MRRLGAEFAAATGYGAANATAAGGVVWISGVTAEGRMGAGLIMPDSGHVRCRRSLGAGSADGVSPRDARRSEMSKMRPSRCSGVVAAAITGCVFCMMRKVGVWRVSDIVECSTSAQ